MSVEDKLKKTFDHILISAAEDAGPVVTLGGFDFKFKPKIPVVAIIEMQANDNNFRGMVEFVKKALIDPRQEADFESLLDNLDGDGLAEVVEWVIETTTGFSSNTPPD